MTVARTPALGGQREVPVPDSIARDFLLLALRLDQHLPGLVDGYFGPADLKARVDIEQLAPLNRLAAEAASLREHVASEVTEPDRRTWLDLQLVALEVLARERQTAQGSGMPYLDLVERCFAHRPERRPDALFEQAASDLEARLPGPGSLAERLAAEDAAWTIAPDRVQVVVERLIDRFRARAATLFRLPDGEQLRVSLVRGQPWIAYNWYDGGYRSRVDLNLDLPIRLPALVGTIAHEAYPGHHLEHASKEQALVEGLHRLEASILLINTPECLISEGLADAGQAIAVPPADLPGLLSELAPMAGLDLAGDPPALASAAERARAIAGPRAVLDETGLNAAILRHQDGWPRERVLEYLVEVGRFAPETAAKRLEFIEHPLWRLYVHVYAEGRAMVERWLDAVDEPNGGAPGSGSPTVDSSARVERFARLLREPLTPPAIAG